MRQEQVDSTVSVFKVSIVSVLKVVFVMAIAAVAIFILADPFKINRPGAVPWPSADIMFWALLVVAVSDIAVMRIVVKAQERSLPSPTDESEYAKRQFSMSVVVFALGLSTLVYPVFYFFLSHNPSRALMMTAISLVAYVHFLMILSEIQERGKPQQ